MTSYISLVLFSHSVSEINTAIVNFVQMQNDSWESYLMFNGQRFTENIRSDPRQLIFVTRDYQDDNIVEMKAVLDYRMVCKQN